MFEGDLETRVQAEQFQATVAIDPVESAKHFQGVWLVREDGDRWLIDYRANEHWRPFEDASVEVSGVRYTPGGQSVGAVHFRLHTLRVIDPTPDHHLINLGPERRMEGQFIEIQGGPGTKSEAQIITMFATSGMRYFLANYDESFKGAGTATVRETRLSPFMAHLMGPRVWVLSFDSKADSQKSESPGE